MIWHNSAWSDKTHMFKNPKTRHNMQHETRNVSRNVSLTSCFHLRPRSVPRSVGGRNSRRQKHGFEEKKELQHFFVVKKSIAKFPSFIFSHFPFPIAILSCFLFRTGVASQLSTRDGCGSGCSNVTWRSLRDVTQSFARTDGLYGLYGLYGPWKPIERLGLSGGGDAKHSRGAPWRLVICFFKNFQNFFVLSFNGREPKMKTSRCIEIFWVQTLRHCRLADFVLGGGGSPTARVGEPARTCSSRRCFVGLFHLFSPDSVAHKLLQWDKYFVMRYSRIHICKPIS